jgi:hypothetical protein
MRTGAPAGYTGLFHQAAIYGSDQERHDIIVAHIAGALEAGEPVLAALGPGDASVRAALRDASNVTWLPPLDASSRPAKTIKDLTAILTPLAAEGWEQIRVVQDVPHPGVGIPWDGWCRYEAAVNGLLADLPLWGLCLYDRRTTPTHVLRDVEQTHPHVTTADGGHQANAQYLEPAAFLRSRNLLSADPLEQTPPSRELIDPAPATSRRAVHDSSLDTGLGSGDIDQLILATSEAVTNAIVHGKPPVLVKIWAVPDRMVVTISDRGGGPADPYIGLVPQRPVVEGGGLGLWIVHQLVEAALGRTDYGFTLRLAAGHAPAVPQLAEGVV